MAPDLDAAYDDQLHDADSTNEDAAKLPDDVVEAKPTDLRETSTPDATEKTDTQQRRRLPHVDETTAAVTRAQAALAEIAARAQADAARTEETAAEQAASEAARQEELNRWAGDDTRSDGENTADIEPELARDTNPTLHRL